MKNQSSVTGMATQYRRISVFWKVVILASMFTPLLCGICASLWGFVCGLPFLSVVVLLVFLMVYTPRKEDLKQVWTHPASCPFVASEAGIAFSPSGLTVNWKQIRKWAEEKEGVSVTLDCLPFELPETLEARVLVHENGVSCTLTPDSYLDRQALIQLFRSFDPLQEGEKQ
ncbi:hypothetical protein [Faecalibaculum rodentium]|uniref:hypothetical protein n=2 Tax=Faecalibaculum rodentium TaxID=1702221 RepID=UPI0023F16139|nr:hypothetical protein [Faecalibaculum rodentium]